MKGDKSKRVLANCLTFSLEVAGKCTAAMVRSNLKPLRVHIRQYYALMAINQEILNQSTLAELLRLNQNAVVDHMNALEKKGLAIRKQNPLNRREHKLEITEKGRLLLNQAKEQIDDACEDLIKKLDGGEELAFRNIIQKLNLHCVPAANLKS